ncbi:MAG: YeiH family protein [Clostridiales Family XIII bacterium]|jgi:uncharacterized integral membrane protein (TIGR00698 family)|nr:YeiH family protein [Clostridiales Family XIII bacterium]
MKKILPGMLICVAAAVPAYLIGRAVPAVGGPIIGMLFGIILSVAWKRPASMAAGIAFTSKNVLQYSIVLLGFGMNLFAVLETGGRTLFLMAFTFSAAFLSAWVLGKALKAPRNANILIGVGTAICGGSAIMAVAPVIGADDEEIASSISTIFLFNIIAAFLFPPIGHLLGMSDDQFGLWAGTAINDTSSVVAAGYAFSDAAGGLAVIVKLTRTLMIVPVTLALAISEARRSLHARHKTAGAGENPASGKSHFAKAFPWFVAGFAATSVIVTFVPLPGLAAPALASIGKFAIIAAMAAIGLNTNIPKLLKNGLRPVLLGFCVWMVLSACSLAMQLL